MIRTWSIWRSGRQDFPQAPRAHQQRVAPGQQHVADLRVALDVREAGRHVVGRLVVVVHEQTLAEAVPAVGAAYLVAQQQRRVVVLVLYAARDRVGLFVARVERAVVLEFVFSRDHQLADRVVGPAPVDQAGVVVVDSERVPRCHRLEPAPLVVCQLLELCKLRDVLHSFNLLRRCRYRGRRCVHGPSFPASARRGCLPPWLSVGAAVRLPSGAGQFPFCRSFPAERWCCLARSRSGSCAVLSCVRMRRGGRLVFGLSFALGVPRLFLSLCFLPGRASKPQRVAVFSLPPVPALVPRLRLAESTANRRDHAFVKPSGYNGGSCDRRCRGGTTPRRAYSSSRSSSALSSSSIGSSLSAGRRTAH